MMFKINKKIILFIIVLFILSVTGGWIIFTQKEKYNYDVEVSSAGGYSVLLDFNHNYFIDENGKIILPFTPGGVAEDGWGGGVQATNLGERQVLPYKVVVRWFSLAENQFWEGEAIVNQEKLEQLKHYEVNNIYQTHQKFLKSSTFVVSYAPGGLVTIWIVGKGEEYLLTQFKAHKTDINWDAFFIPIFGEYAVSREKYLSYQTERNGKNSFRVINDQIQQEIREHKVPGAEPWLRLMNKYKWQLTVNNFYYVKEYITNYVNGERYFTHSKQEENTSRAVPLTLVTFLENRKDHGLIRLDIDFDQDEIINAFETLNKQGNEYNPINLYIDINNINIGGVLTKANVYLIKDTEKIEIKKGKATHQEYPQNDK